MTRAEVNAGDCGHTAVIEVSQLDSDHVRVVVHSECEQLSAMNSDLANLRWQGKGNQVFRRMTESSIYESAAKHIRHTACPIPAAILKAIEVEVGLALPGKVLLEMTFSDGR
ncbi:MAG: hypothetical protein ACE5JF_11365 [Anaerolineales bacterium]